MCFTLQVVENIDEGTDAEVRDFKLFLIQVGQSG